MYLTPFLIVTPFLIAGGNMTFWFKKKIAQFREVSLPGEVGIVSVPADSIIEMEDDTTLLVRPSSPEMISLRFSCFSFSKKGDMENAGQLQVRRNAAEKGMSCLEMTDKSILSYQKESEEDGVPLTIKFWEIGSRNTIVIISATIIRSKQNHRLVRMMLEAMSSILDSINITKIHKLIEADGEEIHTITQTVQPVPYVTKPFEAEECRWLETSMVCARALGVKYGSSGDLDPEELDCVFSRWMDNEEEKESNEMVADALGAAFGSYLVEHHGYRWVLSVDEYGSEYAIKHPTKQCMAFPKASVVKRIENKQHDFFKNVYIIIMEQLKNSG